MLMVIASALATAINGISGYTSSSNTNVVSYNRDTVGAATDLTITVTTAGSANLDATDFVHVVTQQGRDEVATGRRGSVRLTQGTNSQFINFSNGATASDITTQISDVINSGSIFSSVISTTDNTLQTATSVARGDIDLEFSSLDPGLNSDGTTPILSITATRTQTGMSGTTSSGGFNINNISLLRGDDGEAAIFPRVNVFRLPDGMTLEQVITAYDAQTLDFATLRPSNSGLQFRDNAGESKLLLLTIQAGGTDVSVAEHYTYSYEWTKNNQTFDPSVTGQTRNRRFIVIDAADVSDGGEDVFSCRVTNNA